MTASDRWWASYAASYDELWGPFAWLWYELAGLLRPGTVLDVASGTGGFARVARTGGHDVVAVDRCAAMLARNRSGAQRVLAAGAALPFRSETFENVVLANVLHLADDAGGLLLEAARVTAPGGALIVTVPPDELGLFGLVRAEHGRGLPARTVAARAARRLWLAARAPVAGIRRRFAADVAGLVSDVGWPAMHPGWPHSDLQLVLAVQRPLLVSGKGGSEQ